jgi:hypothetical protein
VTPHALPEVRIAWAGDSRVEAIVIDGGPIGVEHEGTTAALVLPGRPA